MDTDVTLHHDSPCPKGEEGAGAFSIGIENIRPLGEIVSSMVEHIAESYNTPLDYAFGPALCALSTALGAKVKIRTGPHTNKANLFLVTVGRPGANKSSPANIILKPLRDLNARMFEQYRVEMAKYKAAKADEKPETPVKRNVMLSDVTMERLAISLYDNPQGLLLYRDEIGAYLQAVTKYSSTGGEYRALCEIHDGMQLTIDRKSDDLYFVDSPYLTLFGTTQPNSLKEVFGKPELANSGFLQRFCFLYPDVLPDFKELSTQSTLDLSKYRDWEGLLMTLVHDLDQVTVKFSPDTWTRYNKFLALSHRNQLDSEDYEAQVWSKLNITVAKLAGICAVVAGVSEGIIANEYTIEKKDFKFAVMLAMLLRDNQLRIFNEINGANPKDELKRSLKTLKKQFKSLNYSKLAEALGMNKGSVYSLINRP